MKRRDLMAGLAAVGVRGGAEQTEQGSLYMPEAHRVEDRKLLHDFMEEFAFADLVTAAPGIRITHIPMLVEREAGKYGKVYGHVSRQNPQSRLFDGQHEAVAVFRGPHSYISPTWYGKGPAVPTWNFAAVHASGRPRAIEDKQALRRLLVKLIGKFENYESSTYDFNKLPESYTNSLMSGIVGFEMEIELLEGKFKLGQERSDADRNSILAHLEQGKPERSIHDLTASFYERMKAAGKRDR